MLDYYVVVWCALAASLICLGFGVARIASRAKRVRVIATPREETRALELFTRFRTVPFEDALRVIRGVELVRVAAIEQEHRLGSNVAPVAALAISIAEALWLSSTYVASFTPDVRLLLASGGAQLMRAGDGRLLLVAVDAVNGRILQHANLVASGVGAFAMVPGVVVGVANLIANYETAKRLRRMDRKLDELLHRERESQVSELQASYSVLQELLSAEPDKGRLHAERRTLERLRIALVMRLEREAAEFRRKLPRSVLSLVVNPKGDLAVAREELAALEDDILLLRFNVLLELAAAQMADAPTPLSLERAELAHARSSELFEERRRLFDATRNQTRLDVLASLLPRRAPKQLPKHKA